MALSDVSPRCGTPRDGRFDKLGENRRRRATNLSNAAPLASGVMSSRQMP
jgi:hypothetical protein